MPDTQEVLDWRGQKMIDRNGDKIGSIEEIYLDRDTDNPEWALVKTGFFGGKGTFVPLAKATAADGGVQVPYEKAHVKDAPSMDADGELSQDEEARLYDHYGLHYGEGRSDSGLPEGEQDAGFAAPGEGTVGRDTSGRTADEAMTRSEEELRVGTTRREVGRARLRKYIVTENVQTTVPVQREEVRVEREPVTEANIGDATTGPELSEEEHEVTLHAEEPVVEKDVVAKERVRLDKDVVTEERQVDEDVRREQIEMEGGPGTDRA